MIDPDCIRSVSGMVARALQTHVGKLLTTETMKAIHQALMVEIVGDFEVILDPATMTAVIKRGPVLSAFTIADQAHGGGGVGAEAGSSQTVTIG